MQKRDFFTKWSILVSIVALILSLLALIINGCHHFNCDVTGLMVTVLCMLVTILISWQIYNVIEIKEQLRRVDEMELSIAKAHNKALMITMEKLGSSMLNLNGKTSDLDAFVLGSSLDAFFSVIDYWDGTVDDREAMASYYTAINKIESLSERGHVKLASPEKKRKYIELAMKTGNERLISFARKCTLI